MRMMKILPALVVGVSMISYTGGQAYAANTDIQSQYLVNADVKAHGTTIEVNAGLKGGTVIDSKLLNQLEWEIVDQNGKTLYVNKASKAQLNVKIENLQPKVEYCLDVRLKAKALDAIKTKLNLEADQKIALTKKGLKIKKGLLCVTTGDQDPNDPKNPQDPVDPKDPNNPQDPVDPKDPKNPKDPKEPQNPKDPKQPNDPKDPVDPKNPENPKDPKNPKEPVKNNAETEPSTEESSGGWFDWFFNLFK